MGKGMLLVVSFAIAGAGLLLFSGQRSTLETKEAQGDYQYQTIARDIAKSGFERGVSAVKRQLMAAPGTFNDVGMQGGTYDLQISANLYGDLDLSVNARSGEAEHDIDGNVIFTAPLPAAVVLEDDQVDVSHAAKYKISGVDVRMPAVAAGAGYRDPVPGVLTRQTHASLMNTEFNASSVVGQGNAYLVDEGSYDGGYDDELETYLETLYTEARNTSVSTVGFFTPQAVRETLFRGAVNASNRSNPKIVRVQGGITLPAGSPPLHGYGLLLVEDGDLLVHSNDFQWEGLVMVRKHKADSVNVVLGDGVRVHGGLIAYDLDTGSNLACVPDFNIDGNTIVVNDSFKVYIEVLGAAISFGGLYDMPVTARLHVGGQAFQPWGSYNQALGGNLNKPGRFVFDPGTVFPAGAGIRIDAKSWKRLDGMDGTQNSHWTVHMEKTSQTVDSRLEVLRDGDDVPNVAGFLDQASVADFVSGYVEGDKMKMDRNEAVNLFELGMNNPASAAHDMQDLVLLVSMVKASEGGCVPGAGDSYLRFALGNDTEIHYSSEAVAKLGLLLDTVRNNTGVKVTRNKVRGKLKKEAPTYADPNVAVDDREDDTEATGGDRVDVCHKPHDDGGRNKSVKRKDLGKHIAHGDYVGTCTGGDDD